MSVRAANATEAFIGQNKMHRAAQEAGQGFGAGCYAVLLDGEAEYDYAKVLWVNLGDVKEGSDPQATHAAVTMLGALCTSLFLRQLLIHVLFIVDSERGKAEALLGNPAGVYLVFKSVFAALKELDVVKQRKVLVSEQSLIKQLENE